MNNNLLQLAIEDYEKTQIDAALRNLIECMAARPASARIGNLNYIIDNLNELGTDYTITLNIH